MQTAYEYARAAELALHAADENEREGHTDVADAYRDEALVWATLAVAAATSANR